MHIVQLTEGTMSDIFRNPHKYRRSEDILVQSTIIFDMEGFSMSQIASKRGVYYYATIFFSFDNIDRMDRINLHLVGDMIIQLVTIMESNYPEFYRRIIIINGTFIKYYCNQGKVIALFNYSAEDL